MEAWYALICLVMLPSSYLSGYVAKCVSVWLCCQVRICLVMLPISYLSGYVAKFVSVHTSPPHNRHFTTYNAEPYQPLNSIQQARKSSLMMTNMSKHVEVAE
jgi:hypothetical protein